MGLLYPHGPRVAQTGGVAGMRERKQRLKNDRILSALSRIASPKRRTNFRAPDIPLKSGQNWGFLKVGCGP
jgi:hypothetical protein